MNVLVFDIETIPDVRSIRQIYKLGHDQNDAQVVEWISKKFEEEKGSSFLPVHLHRVICISAVMQKGPNVRVWSIGDETTPEKELIQRFFAGIEKYTPDLVSWNGNGFDLPVLNYRAMHHHVLAPRYWEMGENDMAFKWNNYVNRYHTRHLDLMDVLALYQPRAYVGLDQAAVMMGFPGKLDQSGAGVWDQYQAGQIAGIRNYCETDVLNTYLLFLRFELMRGRLFEQDYKKLLTQLRSYLRQENKPHFEQFLSAWPEGEELSLTQEKEVVLND